MTTSTATATTPELGRGRTLPSSQAAHVFATVLTGLLAGFSLVGMGIAVTGNVELNDELAEVEASTAALALAERTTRN